MKITIKEIVNTKPDKFGTSVRIKAEEFGDKVIFMMSTKDASSIRIGETYEGEAELWKEIEGTKWMAWKWPKKEETSSGTDKEQLDRIEAKIDRLLPSTGKPEYPTAEKEGIDHESTPF